MESRKNPGWQLIQSFVLEPLQVAQTVEQSMQNFGCYELMIDLVMFTKTGVNFCIYICSLRAIKNTAVLIEISSTRTAETTCIR